MNRLLLPALLTSLMLQVTPVSAASSGSATIDWDSLNIQLIDLSGGTNAPVLTWTNMYAQSSSDAYTVYPYDYQSSNLSSNDFVTSLDTNATTANAQASASHDVMALTASTAAQPGIVPINWGWQQNYAYASSYNSGDFTLTGYGLAIITIDWSVEGTGNLNDWSDYTYTSAYVSANYWDNLYNNGSASSGYALYTANNGSYATSGSFAMSVLNTNPNGTNGYLSASVYSQSHSLSAPIPEPETYALMLVGLGLVGFMARRRKV